MASRKRTAALRKKAAVKSNRVIIKEKKMKRSKINVKQFDAAYIKKIMKDMSR